jgi:peptidylprolyl isomerase
MLPCSAQFYFCIMPSFVRNAFLAILFSAALFAAGCDSTVLDTSGELIIEDLEVGVGDSAFVGGRVTMHAKGMLTNGNVFLETRDRPGMPFTFVLGRRDVIPGWDEGIPGMKEGGLRRLTVPPHMAFGLQEDAQIPRNSTVIFEIRLLRADGADELAIEDITVGTGAVAVDGKELAVHYVGFFGDGTTFDSSRARGSSFSFILGDGDVIRGWDLGLQGMQVGGKRLLIIPPSLAYGPGGVPGSIPPDATLVFEVELLSVGG